MRYYSPSALINNKSFNIENGKVMSLEQGKMRISAYSVCIFLVLKRLVDQKRTQCRFLEWILISKQTGQQ